MILNDLRQHLYWRPSQLVITLQRQGSGRDNFFNSQFRKSSEMRKSGRAQLLLKKNMFDASLNIGEVEIIESLDITDPEADSSYFMAILVKCLMLLDKAQFALNVNDIFNLKLFFLIIELF